jgi:AcrR family transcriptional regulator
MSEGTSTRLLQAAEQILIDEGVHALTIRRIGAVSGLNPALVTYHFGSVANLLAELCRHNLDPILEDWQPLTARRGMKTLPLDELLTVWLEPLTRPAAFNPHGRALVVLDEIASHGDSSLSEMLLEAMVGTAARVASLIRPHVPGLGKSELRARLRFISAAALGPPPRNVSRIELTEAARTLSTFPFLFAFAKASLTEAICAMPTSAPKKRRTTEPAT